MPGYKTLLDAIRDEEGEPPEIVSVLGLPGIDDWSTGRVVTTVQIARYLDGPVGVFGGYLAMITDTMATHVSMTLLDDHEWIVTTNLEVEFRRALRTHQVIANSTANRDDDTITCTIEYRAADSASDSRPAATATVVERVRSTRTDKRGGHAWNESPA